MEYLGGKRPGDHREFALELRKRRVTNRIAGLVHLPMNALSELYDKNYIKEGLDVLDNIIVFGSSLAKDLKELGYTSKVKQTFHYVDTDYYKPLQKNNNSSDFNVISMGFLYRNRNILKEIILQCPEIKFHLCLGNDPELHSIFSEYQNAVLHKFIPEKDLLYLMQTSNVSLSVFDDTVGSNVITTSLACGLPQVLSDTGSIRDYCSNENSIFCQNSNEYINALKELKKDRQRCFQMGINARNRAEEISLQKSIDWYRQLFLDMQ